MALRSWTGAALIAARVAQGIGGRGYGHALVHGYQPAMIVMGGLCVAAALITALFVTDNRKTDNRKTGNRKPGPRIVPRAPEAGCATACVPPTPDPSPTAGGLT